MFFRESRLDVKDRLFNLGHKVHDFIVQKDELDYIDRMEQIRAAYALICYTAYFDVLENAIPKKIIKKAKLRFENKQELVEKAIEGNDAFCPLSTIPDVHCNVYYADHLTSFTEIKKQLLALYECITNNFLKMLLDSVVFDENNEKEKQELEKIKSKLEKVPQKAIEAYEAQYLNLADQFNDFALFAQLKNFESISHAVEKNGSALDLLVSTAEKIDIGLSNLNSVVNSIATNYSAIQSLDIVDDLKNKYIATIQEPIIDDKEIKSDTESISLKFPRIVDAFIPQSYKCLSYQQRTTKLEDASVWENVPNQHDLDKFFVEYLYSPESIDYPLIILGQPGSGKSLLTKVLSAQLMSSSYTVIRIPLREVNADDGIDVLVEDQIKKVTNRPLSTQGYGGFAKQFNEKPLMIILDGYDELLQAKGDVFSGYLEKVRSFQQDQKTLKRPVRIIITSRITLIDKARIPENSTILRLMEFDPEQQQAWIDIWNKSNAEYFANTKIKPFKLPSSKNGEKNSITELAEQPLLLLMLALYDSDANELAETSDIQRTELYDNLLRRFVRRERGRYVKGFVDKSPEEQENIIDQEMNRLGVVAIGMYNRKGVVIRSRQLENDLDLFDAHRGDGSPKLHTLKESESVLGGFFFIHKSTAQDNDADSSTSESAYEFLHNTFGEFLTADFILRNTIDEVKDIYVDRKFKSAGLNNKLSNPDSLYAGWFYCLMFVPLYSRPVVIEMLREHAPRALQRALKLYDIPINISQEDFIQNLIFLVKNQLKMILNTRNSPSVMRGDILFDQDIPLLGYLATYSLNLVILACSLSTSGFKFNEMDYVQSENSVIDSRPWEKLTLLWRAWFSPSDLMGLSVIVNTKRTSNLEISVECNEKFEATPYEQSIDILLCNSFTLSDNLLVGLSGLQTPRFREITRLNDEKICKLIKDENPDLYFLYLVNLLRKEINYLSLHRSNLTEASNLPEYTNNLGKINRLIDTIIYDDKISDVNNETLLTIFEVLEYSIIRNIVFISTCKHICEDLLFKLLRRTIQSKTVGNLTRFYANENFLSEFRLLKLIIKNFEFVVIRYEYGISVQDRIVDTVILDAENFQAFSFQNMRNRINHDLLMLDITNRLLFLDRYEVQLDEFFEDGNIKILIETDPELLSFWVLNTLKNHAVKKRKANHIATVFLRAFLRLLESVGLGYFELITVSNAVKIALSLDDTSLLHSLKEIIMQNMYAQNPFSLMGRYSLFIAELMDVIPDIFIHFYSELHQWFFSGNIHLNYRNPIILYYFKIFRRFFQEFVRKGKQTEEIPRTSPLLDDIVLQSNLFINIQFTIGQIEDLAWYVNFTDNAKVKTHLTHMFELQPYGIKNYFKQQLDYFQNN